MPFRPPVHQPDGYRTKAQRDRQRLQAQRQDGQRVYDLARWRMGLQPWFLSRNPLCCMCEREGVVRAATVVDHIRPHGGRMDPLAWDPANLQSLCALHHNEKTGREVQSRRG